MYSSLCLKWIDQSVSYPSIWYVPLGAQLDSQSNYKLLKKFWEMRHMSIFLDKMRLDVMGHMFIFLDKMRLDEMGHMFIFLDKMRLDEMG